MMMVTGEEHQEVGVATLDCEYHKGIYGSLMLDFFGEAKELGVTEVSSIFHYILTQNEQKLTIFMRPRAKLSRLDPQVQLV